MKELGLRAIKFGLAGVAATTISYLSFVALLRFMHYFPAATISWTLSLGTGFLLNRRFTFRITGKEGRLKEISLFTLAASLQYAIAMIGYAILIGYMKLNPTVAFLVNLTITTAFSFIFHNLITFGKRNISQ
jgi:putative flippase GtrA